RDSSTPMPQDHDEAYWTQWRLNHSDPKRFRKGAGPDTIYVEVYPQDCEMIPQPSLRPGEEPKYVAEVWWQIGNWEFDQLDFGGGVGKDQTVAVYDYNRAAGSYHHSRQNKKPLLYGDAFYKSARSIYQQQQYEATPKIIRH